MALRRQGLSQRRKAVGLTQESLAERLGVERSTVVRWEAGDTEPLPSIRPKVARALQVSVDQLAELLNESENATTTEALPADDEVTVPVLLPEVQPDRTELEDPARPQVADPVEALRQALRAAGVVPEDLGAMLLAGRPPQVPLGSPTAIPPDVVPADVQRRQARPRRFNRLAVMGVLLLLAFVGGAASVPLLTSHRGPIPTDAIGASAPVAAIPAPGSGSSSSPSSGHSTGAVHPVPAADPSKPADTPATAAVPAPHPIRSGKRIISRSKSRASMTRSGTPRTPAEANAWLTRWAQHK